MSCNDNSANSYFGKDTDFSTQYTGLEIYSSGWRVVPGENLRSVLTKLLNAVKNIEEGNIDIKIPVIILDESVGLETTGSYLNSTYPDIEIGSTIHNGLDYKFIKMTPTKWEPLVMNLI